MLDATEKLRRLEADMRRSVPVAPERMGEILQGLSNGLSALHRDETAAAKRLLQLVP
jgi:hypothetical protein